MHTIREIEKSEAKSLAVLHEMCFPDKPWSEQQVKDSLVQATTCALAVHGGNRMCAFLLVQDMGQEAEILSLGVAPNSRGQGVARQLIEHYLSDKPNVVLFLDVAADNVAAITLYESLGFNLFSSRKGYYERKGERVDALNYRLKINS